MAGKAPHQVNLVIWVNDGRDQELVDALNRTLDESKSADIIHTDPDDPTWYWHGLKGVSA